MPDSAWISSAQYGSDVIVDLLKALGIEYAAFNPGSSFRGLHDSIVNYGGNRQPEVIECGHEEVSVAIAHGYAKAAGRPMVAIAHDVVGLQHASMAIFNAWCDRVPVLVLGGTGPMDLTKRRPWIDWIHTALVQGTLVRDYVKWDDQPHTLAAVPESLLRAYRTAMTEPQGPVYVCYDVDLQESPVTEPIASPEPRHYGPPTPLAASPDAVQQAAEWLLRAERPVIIADAVGRHPDAVGSLVELAELLAIPVLDHGARFNIPNTHALDCTGAEAELLPRADVVLALDVVDLFRALTRLERQTRTLQPLVSDAAKIVHISLADFAIRSWAGDYQRLHRVDLPIAADTSVAIPQLLVACRDLLGGAAPHTERLKERFARIRARHDAQRQGWRDRAQQLEGQTPMAPAAVAAILWEVIKDRDWRLVNGTLNGWARRLWEWTQPWQYLGGSGGAGVGYAAGASLGAALATKGSGRLCIDLQSDGDLLACTSALWTAAHHQIPLLMVMHNNRSLYNSEEHAEEVARFRGRPVANKGIGTRLDEPPVDFATVARGFGIYAEGPVEDARALRPALERALKVVVGEGRAALVDAVVQPR
jgi:thiamine pyrophosphate-dependent acetolactate synthase large subunit-like protein